MSILYRIIRESNGFMDFFYLEKDYFQQSMYLLRNF